MQNLKQKIRNLTKDFGSFIYILSNHYRMKINIHQIEDPEDLSMATRSPLSHKELNADCTKVKEVHYRRHWKGRYQNNYRYGARFLKKNVGRPWDDVFSEWCEKIKADKDLLPIHQWESTKDVLRDMVDLHDGQRTYGYNDFYVDDRGVLRTYQQDKPAHHKDRVFVKTSIVHRLNTKARPYIPYIIDTLQHHVSPKVLHTLIYEDISESGKDKISNFALDKVPRQKMRDMITHIRKTESSKGRYWVGYVDSIWSLFEDVSEGYYIIRPKNQRIKMRAESIDTRHRLVREADRDKKLQDSLLCNIMKKRKLEEKKAESLKKLIGEYWIPLKVINE